MDFLPNASLIARLLNDVDAIKAVADHRITKGRVKLNIQQSLARGDDFIQLIFLPLVRIYGDDTTRQITVVYGETPFLQPDTNNDEAELGLLVEGFERDGKVS